MTIGSSSGGVADYRRSDVARKEGSGLSRETASTIEELIAAIFAQSRATSALARRLDTEFDRGRSGLRSGTAVPWIEAIADHLGLPVAQATAQPADLLGDVRLTLDDGSHVWIEVKAQTTKTFRELIQADWVRDETDAVRWLCHFQPDVRKLLSRRTLDELGVDDPARHFGHWSLPGLWLADLGLASTRARRAAAGASDLNGLSEFLGRKYLIHITCEGARCVRLDQLHCAQRALDLDSVHLAVSAGGKCDAIVWLSTEGPPRRGAIEFAYYIGYRSGVLGRHKLTDRAVRSSDGLFVVS